MTNFVRRKKDPDIDLDTKGKIYITGDSNPDNIDISWEKFAVKLQEYKRSGADLLIDFKLNSFNSATERYILSKLRDLDLMAYSQDIKVNWHYPDDDEDLLYYGKVYKSFCKKIKINLVKYKYEGL